MGVIETISILIASAMTISLFSYLWKENRAFRIAEHAYIGAAAGYAVLITADAAWKLLDPFLKRGDWHWLITVLIGLMFFFFFSKAQFWVYRYPVGIVTGSGIGVFLAMAIKSQLVEQVRLTTLVTLTKWDPTGRTPFDSAIIAVGVITALSYFYATAEHKGPLKYSAKIGIYFLMAFFGVCFGTTIMARISLLIGRLRFLFFTDPAWTLIPVAAALLIGTIVYEKRIKKTK